MEDKELLAELQAGLKEQGVEATEEEIQAAVEKLQSGELSEDNLEDVAGGLAPIYPAGYNVIVAIGKLFAICPRCRKIYIRKKGHHCAAKPGGGKGTLGGIGKSGGR